MYHFYYKDLWIRFACELLQALYWWNPFIYILRNQIAKVQELRVDEAIICELDQSKMLEYMTCLTKLAKLQIKNTVKWTAAFSSPHEGEVSKRITRLLHNTESRHRFTLSNGIILLLLLVVVLWPNFFIMEPHAMAEEHKSENYFTITKDNAYYILNSYGTYDVYVDSDYLITVINIFDETLSIYNEKGDKIN